MDSSLFERFFDSASTHFQLPTLNEEENDEVHPLLHIEFYRLNKTRQLLIGIQEDFISYVKLSYLFSIFFFIKF